MFININVFSCRRIFTLVLPLVLVLVIVMVRMRELSGIYGFSCRLIFPRRASDGGGGCEGPAVQAIFPLNG